MKTHTPERTDRSNERAQLPELAEDYYEQDGCNFQDRRFSAFRAEVLEILRKTTPG